LTTSPLDAAGPLDADADADADAGAENTSALEAVLDSLRRAATDKRDQGDKFERLMVRFFQTDREWSQRFDGVWTWMEWPNRPAQADLGIDLVARDRETGGYIAIQCKFYDPDSTIDEHHIDSFLAESGRHQFRDRIIVTTTNKWGANAEQAIEGQQIPVQRVRFMDLAESSIDWRKFDLSRPDEMVRNDRKHLRPHQIAARDAVRAGLATGDRGKLIMACGTGKTLTSLRIAEELAGRGGRVLFLVPSISLLNQSLHEWSIEAEMPLRTFAVCSDSTVGRARNVPGESSEDSRVVDLALPSMTDPARLHARLANPVAGQDKLTVVFSTYQSIDVVAEAQNLGSPAFDLIICDEAHRTTGVTVAGEDESAFVKVHDDAYLHAARRLYMTATPRLYDGSTKAKAGQANAVLAAMDDEAIYGPELYRLGFGEAVSRGLLTDCRRYWEQWAGDIAVIAERHTTRIRALLDDPSLGVADTFEQFLAGLRKNLNDSISRDGAIDMLAQHLITRPVFEALFSDYSFAEHNPVSRSMQAMLDALDEHHVDSEAATLEKFYDSVRDRAQGIENAEGKQKIVTELYEKFFKLAFPRAAESLGIVYTPVEIVDFIIRSVDYLLRTEFGASLSDENVHVLDPFTGIGTFIARLFQCGLIRPEDRLRKYTQELHANEILLLAYYIAAINIEATFHGLITAGGGPAETDANRGYLPFDGIVLADTFHLTDEDVFDDMAALPANSERARAQRGLDIRVIIGNPPYSVGQTSGNDNNANLKYAALDDAIEASYAARSTSGNKNSLYDSYIRAFRWASDRIKDQGIVGFVSNGGFIDGNTADGFRKSLTAEFTSIYIFNLRGNQRTAGELSRREGGKVFGSGSRNTVAITLLVKNPDRVGPAEIHYRDIGDYLTREQKLTIVADSDMRTLDWTPITPNEAGDWINQRNEGFATYPSMASEAASPGIFALASPGLQTNRDAWVYQYSAAQLRGNMARMIDFYNEQVSLYRASSKQTGIEDIVSNEPARIKWSSSLLGKASRGYTVSYAAECIRAGLYRPFCRQRVYFDADLNHRPGKMARIFPTPQAKNIGFYVTGIGSDKPFSVLATDLIPDLAFWGSSNGQFFPRYTFTEPDPNDLYAGEAGQRIDNVSDRALADYRGTYGAEVSKDDVFYYVYGLLHSPDYRAGFAADLRKMLPRIPKVSSADDFQAFVAAGRELAILHIGYEAVEPYPLLGAEEPPLELSPEGLHDFYRVDKMKFDGKGTGKDCSTIIYNSRITVSGIPDVAHQYLLGSRSGIEWVMERYQVKTDKASAILNDPNDWSREVGDPRYILDLLARVVTVSVETRRIVDGLPSLALG
jgi:predicted helicase